MVSWVSYGVSIISNNALNINIFTIYNKNLQHIRYISCQNHNSIKINP